MITRKMSSRELDSWHIAGMNIMMNRASLVLLNSRRWSHYRLRTTKWLRSEREAMPLLCKLGGGCLDHKAKSELSVMSVMGHWKH